MFTRTKLDASCTVLFGALCLARLVCTSTVVVECPMGDIQGVKKADENTGQSYLSFKGIPYAKPPVGDLRFTKPQPHPHIDGIFDATKDNLIVCPHPDTLTFGMSGFTEDCLILNIQYKDTGPSNTLKKVLVYIHGGGFQVGMGVIHDSTSFVMGHDVIVVTINYRLGVLGFLSTENEASPGNYGLWDQTLAIKWVKDNIRAFGGDPDDITLTGQSAGGVSVGLQSISPHTKGLFTKAYQLSGSASSIFALSTKAQSQALAFAQSVGCWTGDVHSKIDLRQSSKVMTCIRKLPLSTITFFATSDVSRIEFVPRVDGDFLPDKPVKLLKDDAYLDSIGFFDRTYMVSIVNNEVGLVESFMKMTKGALAMIKDMSVEHKQAAFDQFVEDCKNQQMLRLEDAEKDEKVVAEVVDFYEKRHSDKDVVTELMVDLSLLIASLDFLSAASRRKSSSAYFLYFNHFPRFVTGPRKGVPHEADLAFWFDFDLGYVEMLVNAGIRPELFDDDDREVKRLFSDIIGDFTRSGNPGLALKDILPNGWPKYDVENSHYLNFNLKPWVGSFLEKDKQDFWFKTVPSLISAAATESSKVVVECPMSDIQGVKKTDENTGQSYLSFKGIPYAKPPVGDLRFTKPQPHPKIDGVFDATKDTRILCPHPSSTTLNETKSQEDCLVLNIQTKDIAAPNALRKVVVSIHGGAFSLGSSSFYDSKSFVMSHDVIVVTINYRLGVLGFLSTENEASPGNYGLWDQTLAIKWVKDNIRAFGGDPDDITIAGESAGGMSVGYQSLSPHAKGLFTKVYPQSGTATSVLSRSVDAQSDALELAKRVGCWDKDVGSKINPQESKTLVDCLRKAPVSDIVDFNGISSFKPRVDGDFIPDIPTKLLGDDEYLESVGFFDRSYLIGINNNEASYTEYVLLMIKQKIFSDNQMSGEEKELTYNKQLADIKQLYLYSRLGNAGVEDVAKIDDFYNKTFSKDRALIEMVTDLDFLIPSLDFLSAASRRSSCSSYLLYFDYFPGFLKGRYRGTPHGLDLVYLFDMDLSFIEMALKVGIQGELVWEDSELKRSFSSIIGDFIKTGNPGLTSKSSLPSGWPRYDVTNSNYLHFNSKPWVNSFLEKDKQDLWFGAVTTMNRKNIHVHPEL